MSILTFAQIPSLAVVHAAAWWSRLDLLNRLAVAASATLIVGFAYAASVVAGHIEEVMVHRQGAATALYMDSFVQPRIQELSIRSTLSEENRQALENLLSPASMSRPVVAFRIWVGDRITFSNEHQLIGRQFPASAARIRAWSGQVSAEIDHLSGADDAQLRALNVHADALASILSALNEALGRIRKLSASLVPSDIETLTPGQTVAVAARRHEWTTGTRVACVTPEFPDDIPFSVRACLYRFVQEGLEILSKRAGVDAQVVNATRHADGFQVEVVGGFSTPLQIVPPLHGLEGALGEMRDRVESLGGVFLLRGDARATAITARFTVRAAEADRGG